MYSVKHNAIYIFICEQIKLNYYNDYDIYIDKNYNIGKYNIIEEIYDIFKTINSIQLFYRC